jgi:DNA replication protein DnaC
VSRVLRPVPDNAAADALQADAPCPFGECDGSGFVLDEETNTARRCTCLERRAGRAAGRRLGTGIPSRFRGLSFDRKPICDLDQSVLREVRGYVHDIEGSLETGRGLWFYGDVGTGKTSLAMLVSEAAASAGRSLAIYPMARLLAEIRETYDDASENSYMQLFRRLCAVDLLHLDDLGAEHRTEWVLEQLYSIVNERWQDRKAIIATTNLLDLDELRKQLGARTVSRLMEICGDPIPVMGGDLRMSSAP